MTLIFWRSRFLHAECLVAILSSCHWVGFSSDQCPPSFAKFSCHISCSCYCKHLGCCRDMCICRCELFAFCRIMQTFSQNKNRKKNYIIFFVQACSKNVPYSHILFWYSLVQKFVLNSASGLSEMYCASDFFFFKVRITNSMLSYFLVWHLYITYFQIAQKLRWVQYQIYCTCCKKGQKIYM